MFEKNEKWIVLAVIALAIYYFFKKGKAQMAQVDQQMGLAGIDVGIGSIFRQGSLVSPVTERYTTLPAQSTAPLTYTPAQPSGAGAGQVVSAGSYTYQPRSPILRSPLLNVRTDYFA